MVQLVMEAKGIVSGSRKRPRVYAWYCVSAEQEADEKWTLPRTWPTERSSFALSTAFLSASAVSLDPSPPAFSTSSSTFIRNALTSDMALRFSPCPSPPPKAYTGSYCSIHGRTIVRNRNNLHGQRGQSRGIQTCITPASSVSGLTALPCPTLLTSGADDSRPTLTILTKTEPRAAPETPTPRRGRAVCDETGRDSSICARKSRNQMTGVRRG